MKKDQIAEAIKMAVDEVISHPEEVEDPDKKKVGIETTIAKNRQTLEEVKRRVQEKTELFAPCDSANLKPFRNELFETLMTKFVPKKGNKK